MTDKAQILFEPLPIGRIGIRKEDEEVIIAKDFSTYAYMLEEYISFGAVKIIIPGSSPESSTINQMPLLLKDRIKIIDDSNDIEIVNGLLFNLLKEFNAKIDNNTNKLVFQPSNNKGHILTIERIHADVKKLVMGFNHSLQISINTISLINDLQKLRSLTTNINSRLILAQLESVLRQYEEFKLDTITSPNKETPIELINIFDKLINDSNYLEYSESIEKLRSPSQRENAIFKLKSLSRIIGSKSYLGNGWDYLTKIIQLGTGVPLPNSKAIASVIKNRQFPIIVNMESAKKRVFENWKNSDLSNIPLSRNGAILSKDLIDWVPLTDSVDVSGQDGQFLSLGKVKDVLHMLEKAGYPTHKK
jgi:hypothetical protein